MDIQSLNITYIIVLIVTALVCGVVGVIVTKKFNNHKLGFLILLSVSLLAFLLITNWYAGAFVKILLVTIPLIFNIFGAAIGYMVYLIIAFFVLRKVSKSFAINLN
ncbi:hypothetical protein [Bacillus sp. PS06]|uniref:hypothetical protein n=1 Tax=Bacillus sp. PS06 TaxID=2764176 RepID=UPI001785CFB4|nr:hypothetical protein [Bacillus sp. PS06]MBD8069730.1 hypothetical protein [Bacillus sp. PS06]